MFFTVNLIHDFCFSIHAANNNIDHFQRYQFLECLSDWYILLNGVCWCVFVPNCYIFITTNVALVLAGTLELPEGVLIADVATPSSSAGSSLSTSCSSSYSSAPCGYFTITSILLNLSRSILFYNFHNPTLQWHQHVQPYCRETNGRTSLSVAASSSSSSNFFNIHLSEPRSI